MATQTVEFECFTGRTYTGKLFAQGSDTTVATSGSSTERTNDKGTHRIDFTDVAAGTYRLTIFDGSTAVAKGWVKLAAGTDVYYPYDELNVAAVEGAVGSVTGAVGSVTGNVGGNVAGDVAGKVLGGGASTITGTGVRAVDGSGAALATASALATAQLDLDILTGTDGVVLATAQTNYAPAKAGNQMALVDDAITAAKFDEATAFPLKAADSGSTTVARTGADGDTLETLSDEIDALELHGDSAWATATGFSTHSAADVWAVGTRVLTAGTNIVLEKGVGITGFTDLDAAGVRTAVGLAAANLDAQLGDIPTTTEFEARTLQAEEYFDPSTDVVLLHGDYDAAKTAAQPGDEMDLVDAPNEDALAAIKAAVQGGLVQRLLAGKWAIDNDTEEYVVYEDDGTTEFARLPLTLNTSDGRLVTGVG